MTLTWQSFLGYDTKSTKQQQQKRQNSSKFKTFVQMTLSKGWKGNPTEWEKMSANHVSDQALIPRVYKELLQLNNNNKKRQSNSKMHKELVQRRWPQST